MIFLAMGWPDVLLSSEMFITESKGIIFVTMDALFLESQDMH